MEIHRSLPDLRTDLAHIAASPRAEGVLAMVVRRPGEDLREVLDEGTLDRAVGLVGDNWLERGSPLTPDGSSHPDMQLNLMNARVLDAICGHDRTRWPLAGDQLIVDLDLSPDALPAGTLLEVGEEAVVEVTDAPHRGCAKFADRFGVDALRFVNTGDGAALRYRGVNAKVVTGGTIRPGDRIRVAPPSAAAVARSSATSASHI